MHKMIALIIGMAGIALTSPASATVYQYAYQGFPFGSGDPWVSCKERYTQACLDADTYVPFSGTLTIDETLMPGGRLPGASIRVALSDTTYDEVFRQDNFCTFRTHNCQTFDVRRADGAWFKGAALDAWAGWLAYDGFMYEFIGNTIVEGYFSFDFDENGDIASWQGGNIAGGDNDPFSRPTGDYFASRAYSTRPGT